MFWYSGSTPTLFCVTLLRWVVGGGVCLQRNLLKKSKLISTHWKGRVEMINWILLEFMCVALITSSGWRIDTKGTLLTRTFSATAWRSIAKNLALALFSWWPLTTFHGAGESLQCKGGTLKRNLTPGSTWLARTFFSQSFQKPALTRLWWTSSCSPRPTTPSTTTAALASGEPCWLGEPRCLLTDTGFFLHFFNLLGKIRFFCSEKPHPILAAIRKKPPKDWTRVDVSLIQKQQKKKWGNWWKLGAKGTNLVTGDSFDLKSGMRALILLPRQKKKLKTKFNLSGRHLFVFFVSHSQFTYILVKTLSQNSF